LLFFLVMIASIQMNAQNLHYLFVRPFDLEKNVSDSQELYTKNEALNQLFKKHKVTRYNRFFERSVNPDLNETYEIHADGNIDSLISDLKATQLFRKIEKTDYSQTNTCMWPPAPISDPFLYLGSP